MTGNGRDHDKELRRVEDTLIDDLLKATDAELLAEAEEEGGAKAAADRVRKIVSSAIAAGSKGKLAAAKAALAQARARPTFKVIQGTLAEKKELLQTVIARRGVTDPPLTMAARNADQLSEADVDSLLEDLQALGLIRPEDVNR